jgi:hypothetical protein
VVFLIELFVRAWQSLVSAMGTTSFAVAVSFIVIPLILLFIEFLLNGWAGVGRHWRSNVIVVSVTGAVWIVLFFYHVAYRVPSLISAQASEATAPAIRMDFPIPAFGFNKTMWPQPAVTILPARVTYGKVSSPATNALSDKYTFRIKNTTNRDLYMVSFKLVVMSPNASLDEFRFDVPKSSQKPVDENDPVGSKFGDISGSDCTDSQNNVVFYRFVFHLAPREVREVTLAHVNDGIDSQNAGLPTKVAIPAGPGTTVRAEIAHFSTTPEPILVRGNLTAVPVYIGETLRCSRPRSYFSSDERC